MDAWNGHQASSRNDRLWWVCSTWKLGIDFCKTLFSFYILSRPKYRACEHLPDIAGLEPKYRVNSSLLEACFSNQRKWLLNSCATGAGRNILEHWFIVISAALRVFLRCADTTVILRTLNHLVIISDNRKRRYNWSTWKATLWQLFRYISGGQRFQSPRALKSLTQLFCGAPGSLSFCSFISSQPPGKIIDFLGL